MKKKKIKLNNNYKKKNYKHIILLIKNHLKLL